MSVFFDRHMRGPGGGLELLALALPLVVSQACETVMMFTDRMFLSRLGPSHMSAAMGGGLTCFMFTTLFIGLAGYSSAMVAQTLGAGRPRRCPLIVTQALLISVLAYPLVLLCLPLGHGLFRVAGIAPRQLELQRSYFNILMVGTILGMLRNSLACFFSGIGRTRVIMLAAALSMVVNIGANYILIFGRLGCPALGMRGAAYGTLLGSFAGLLLIAGAYFARDTQRAYGVREGLRFDRAVMAVLLRLGYPAGLEFFLNMLAFNTLITLFHARGELAAAATTIAFNWDMVSFVPLLGVNIGVTSLVGRYIGGRDLATAHRATLSGLKLAGLYSLLLVVAFVLFPGTLVDVFRPRGASSEFLLVRPLAVAMVRLISVYLFADAVMLVFSGALRGAGDTFWTMCLSVTTHWVLAGLAFLLLHVLHLPVMRTWSILVFAFIGFGCAYSIRYRYGGWRRKAFALAALSGGGEPLPGSGQDGTP